jgi:WD40 repeat protein
MLLLVAPFLWSQTTYIDAFNKADSFFNHANYEKAITWFHSSISSNEMTSIHNAEALLKIGLSHQNLENFDSAYGYFKNAYSYRDREKNELVLNEYLPNVVQLYQQLSLQKPDYYDSLKRVTKRWYNVYLRVIDFDSISPVTYILHFPVTQKMGFEDDILSIYAHYDKDLDRETFKKLGEAELIESEKPGLSYKFTHYDSSNINFRISKEDVALAETKIPLIQEDDYLANNYFYGSVLATNYKESLLNSAFIFSKDYDFYRPSIMRYYVSILEEIYTSFVDDTAFTQIHVPMTEGLYKGKSVIDVFSDVKETDVKHFLRFVNDFPAKYHGKKFRFSETFATWIINNAPVSDHHFSDLLISTPLDERLVLIQNYLEDIKEDKSVAFWEKQQELNHQKNAFGEAIKYGTLLTNFGQATGQQEYEYFGKRKNAEIFSKDNQFQKARQLYNECISYYKDVGDIVEFNYCNQELAAIGNMDVSLVVQSGHGMPFFLEFHPRGSYFYTAGWDGIVKKYDAKAKKIIRTTNASKSMINSLEISQSGKYIILGCDEGEVLVLNAKTLETIRRFKHNYSILSATMDKTDSLLAYCGGTNDVYLIDWKNETKAKELKLHKDMVTAVKFSTNVNDLYSAGKDSMVYRWNKDYSDFERYYKIHQVIWDFVIASNDQYFAVVNDDSTMHIWDNYKHKKIGSAPVHLERMGGTTYWSKPTFSPFNDLIVYGQSDYGTRIFNMELFVDQKFKLGNQLMMTNYAFHPSGWFMYGAGSDLKIISTDLRYYIPGETESLALSTYHSPSASTISTTFDSSGKKLISVLYAGTFLYKAVGLDLTNGKKLIFHNDVYAGNYANNYEFQSDVVNVATSKNIIELNSSGMEKEVYPAVPTKYLSYYITDSEKNLVYCIYNDSLVAYNYENQGIEYAVDLPFGSVANMYDRTIHYASKQNVLIISNKDRFLYFFNSETGLFLSKFKVHKKASIKMVKLSMDQTSMLVYHNSGLCLLDLVQQKELWSYNFEDDSDYDNQFSSMAISMDNNYVALGNYNYQVRLFNIISNEEVVLDKSFGWFISNLAFNPQYPYLLVSSEDQQIGLFNYLSAERVVSLFPQNSGDYLWVDDKNNYWAPKSALSGAAFVQKDKAYPLEQFDVLYNRPDLVMQNLQTADPSFLKAIQLATKKRSRLTEGVSIQDLIKLPNLIIKDKEALPLMTAQSNFEFKVEMTDYDSEINKLFVSVNGVPLPEKDLLIEYKANLVELDIDMVLSRGQNIIEIWCENKRGLRSIKESIRVQCRLPDVKPDLYLVAISVSEYLDSNYNLRYAVKDGIDIVNKFVKDTFNYSNVYVDTLFNKRASLANIKGVKELISKAKVDDKVVFYLSGHGLLDQKFDFYFATYDVDFDLPNQKGLAYTSIEGLFEHTKARQRLIIMDACHSGEVDKSELVEDLALNEQDGIKSGVKSYSYRGAGVSTENEEVGLENSFELMKELFSSVSEDGIQVISAAAGNSYALESNEWNNGVFTYALLSGLTDMSADINLDGKITVTEWRDYVIDKVYDLTDGRQKPTVRQENINFDFRVW